MNADNPDILLAVTLAQRAERFLANDLNATGTGLGEKIRSVEPELKRLSPSFLSSLKQFTTARNKIVHEERPSLFLREDFKLVCQKLELEINYYSQKIRSARGANGDDSVKVEEKKTAFKPSPPPPASRARTIEPKRQEQMIIEAEIVEDIPETVATPSGRDVVPFGTEAAAKFLTVCSQGLGEFETLRDALGAARNGDKIYVLPGVYGESLRIEKSVEIIGQGESPEDVVIESDEDIVYLQAPNVAIRACCFRTLAPGRFCLIAANPQPSSVAECTFKAPDGTGIVAVDGSRLLIEKCTFEDSKHGVRVDAAYAAIVGNKFDSNSNGILIRSGCESVIEDNDFIDNDVSAVQLHDDTAARISGNRFSGGAAAVVVAHTSRGSIQNNCFNGHSEQTAIVAMGGNAAVTIQENRYQ